MTPAIQLPTRQLSSPLIALLRGLKVGDKIRIVQTVRVGAKTWNATATGTFRGLNYLSTGVTTERVKEDDIIVPTLHFTKENGELASVSLDEHSLVERI